MIDGKPDIGFDEIHLYIQTGSWGNDSASHNVPGNLNLTAPQGRTTRHFIVPATVPHPTLGTISLANTALEVDGTLKPEPPTDPIPSWTRPPKSLATPVIDPSLPGYYRTRYINLNNNGTPTPWMLSLGGTPVSWFPPGFSATGQSPLRFFRPNLFDDECAGGPCDHDYFNTMVQVVTGIELTEVILWSNLQAEYR